MSSPIQAYVTCSGCGKRGYYTRQLAKKAARAGSLVDLNAYRCPDSITELWHLGHLPSQVRSGHQTRDTLGYSTPRPKFQRQKSGKHRGEQAKPKHRK